MLIRCLHLLLCWLLAGPLCLPARALSRPETRVGGSADFSTVLAPEAPRQVVELHREEPPASGDFAPAVHKYLYASANPVNNIDPSGNFTIGSLQVSIGIQGYLGATIASYGVGKGISAVHLAISDGNLSRFEWFETSDLLAFVPGAVLANVVKLPVQMVTRVGGQVVGKAFAQGGVQRVVNGFSQWFASTGGKLTMRSANGAIIELEKGTTKKGFQHLLERHLTAFWNGSKSDITTLWPSNISPGEMLNLLKEASGKYVVGGPAAQSVTLANGITAKLVVHGGKVTTFFPEAGPGVIHAAELLKAVP